MEPSYLSDYRLGELMGRGAFGQVYKAVKISTGQTIALKIIDTQDLDNNAIESTKHEINVLEKLSQNGGHENVVSYYGGKYYPEFNRFLIEMEFIDGLEFGKYFNKFSGDPNYADFELTRLLRGVLSGLQYVHGNGIIHNDIKPQNMMVTNDGIPKIIDFGLSCTTFRDFKGDQYCTRRGGTRLYLAPEYWTEKIRVFKSDVWAIGVSIFDVKKQPFYKNQALLRRLSWREYMETMKKLYTENIENVEINKLASSNKTLVDLADAMSIIDYKNRISTRDAIRMLMNNGNDNDNNNNNNNNPYEKYSFEPYESSYEPMAESMQQLETLQSSSSIDSNIMQLNSPEVLTPASSIRGFTIPDMPRGFSQPAMTSRINNNNNNNNMIMNDNNNNSMSMNGNGMSMNGNRLSTGGSKRLFLLSHML